MGILSNESSSMDKVRVKVTLGQETRRASAPLPTFTALYELTRALFHSKDHLVFTYVDDMGDKITMSSDIELNEALRISSGLPNQTLILVAVVQPKEDIEEAEDVQIPTKAPQEYAFFNKYSVPSGVFGVFSPADSNEVGAAITSTTCVHQYTSGIFAPIDAKLQQPVEVEIDMVEAPALVAPVSLATSALLQPAPIPVPVPVPVLPTVALPTPSLPILPLSLPPVPVVQSTPVAQKQRRPAPVFDNSPFEAINDLDLYRAHKEYKEKKRALKKKDARKKEAKQHAKKHHRKARD